MIYRIPLVVSLFVLLSGCVNDDAFFSEESVKVITPTVTVVSFLNDINKKGDSVNESDLCFRFVYPIDLGYNTNSSIQVNDFEGLKSIVSTQGNNFNISGIKFPVEIILTANQNSFSIPDIQVFDEVLRNCNLNTFRDDFGSQLGDCYRLQYPVSLFDSERKETLIDSDEDYNAFVTTQGDIYQPEFVFPINLLVAPSFEPEMITSYFSLYEIINGCANCPDEIDFTAEVIQDPSSYRFTSSLNVENNTQLFWSINGVPISSADNSNILLYDFFVSNGGNLPNGAGTFTVCLRVETPSCLQGIEMCREIVIPSSCADLNFTSSLRAGTFAYDFVADFIGIDQIGYVWKVDGEIIEDTDGGANGDNLFGFRFVPGVHQVCIESVSPNCLENNEFCEQIVVCQELSFTSQQQGTSNTYRFNADFLGRNDIMYQWTVDGSTIETDGGQGADNELVFDFTSGTYEVCITADVAGCTALSAQRVCQTITVP